ncbi:hypothetical protein M0R45_000514 [Rubus argutus]|uniref:Uncharacterized protein n=1 Tax=Rubus argutus TaxID=59490 RepID=A0AAW1VS32_RUBAR
MKMTSVACWVSGEIEVQRSEVKTPASSWTFLRTQRSEATGDGWIGHDVGREQLAVPSGTGRDRRWVRTASIEMRMSRHLGIGAVMVAAASQFGQGEDEQNWWR